MAGESTRQQLRRRCVGTSQQAVKSPRGFGVSCPVCRMDTIPYRGGAVRSHMPLKDGFRTLAKRENRSPDGDGPMKVADESMCEASTRAVGMPTVPCKPRVAGSEPADSHHSEANPPCCGCGGPHLFDTVVPSVRWNAVIRAAGLPDYLCASCVVKAFAERVESFTATLWGQSFNGLPIEVYIAGKPALDAAAVSEENTSLRAELTRHQRTIQQAQQLVETFEREVKATKWWGCCDTSSTCERFLAKASQVLTADHEETR
jgi:hypothetical protein